MNEILKLIRSDYYRYKGGSVNIPLYKIFFYLIFGRNHCFSYSFWLRFAHKKNILWPWAKVMHRHLSNKYNMMISSDCKIGYGLYLGHGICMVVNKGTVIGNNVNLSQFLNIGSNKKTPPTIGDNVYVGPNVCIVEDVKVGDNSCIGAGAVVVKDVPEGATVAGVPARVLSFKKQEFNVNKWPL